MRGVCDMESVKWECEACACRDEHVPADQSDSPLCLLPTAMKFKHLPQRMTGGGSLSLPHPY